MATEQFANDASSTLNGAILSTDTTLVVNDASTFPISPQFRLRIETELLLVTGVSGTTFTVTRGIEGTTAAGHASGVAVTHILTSGALAQFRSNLFFELEPMQLDLHDLGTAPAVDFQPSAMIFLDDEFTDTTTARFTVNSENGNPATPVISGGQLTLNNTSGNNTLLQEGPDLDMPQFAVKVHVASVSPGGSPGTYENFAAGYSKDANNFVQAVWRKIDGLASIQAKIGGSGVGGGPGFVVSTGVSWTPPFDIGLSLVASSLALWYRPNGGSWQFINRYDVGGAFNFKTSSLTGWKPTFGCATDSSSMSVAFSSFQVGKFGHNGLRDPAWVTNSDGSLKVTGTSAKFTATLTDPAGAAYCGVMQFDLSTRALSQIGVIFVNRGSALQNDNASHLIDNGDGTFYFAITTWGNEPGATAAQINILLKHETSLALTSPGAYVVSGMAQPTLPGIPGGGGSYDPNLIFDGTNWYMAYTIGPNATSAFYPALASSPDLTTWTLVGADTNAVPYEGTRIVLIAGQYWVLAASSSAAQGASCNIYDKTFTYRGQLRQLYFTGSNAPHPSIASNGNFVHQVTFDATQFNSVNGTQGSFRYWRALRYGLAGSELA